VTAYPPLHPEHQSVRPGRRPAVARESGKPVYTFHTDTSHTREDCLDIAS
jgi:hypothetical protein